MSTVYPENVFRQEVSCTKPGAGAAVPAVVMIPDGVIDLTLYVKGSTGATAKVEESPSSGVSVLTDTPAADWITTDASLASVGTTLTRYNLLHTPVALRVTSLVNDATATLTVVGKRVR
jgi:hypothetical protein